MLSKDQRLFFLRWLKSPWYYGNPLPSSKALGRAMAAQLSGIGPDEYVVELGPGSGVVTRALCQTGLPQNRLIIIERDDAFIAQLRRDFPQALVLQEDACNLQDILKRYEISEVAAVVSSLPLLSIPDKAREAIVRAVFKVVKADGMLIQYTYGLLSPVPKRYQQANGIRGRVAKRIWGNFPPARVWRYTSEEASA